MHKVSSQVQKHGWGCTEKLTSLQVISLCGVKMDKIDHAAASRLNIKVFNTQFGHTLAFVELTVGLILNLLRNANLMDLEMRAGIRKKRMGNILNGKRVGIIGFGRIGQKVRKLLTAFGCEISYYNIKVVKPEMGDLRDME